MLRIFFASFWTTTCPKIAKNQSKNKKRGIPDQKQKTLPDPKGAPPVPPLVAPPVLDTPLFSNFYHSLGFIQDIDFLRGERVVEKKGSWGVVAGLAALHNSLFLEGGNDQIRFEYSKLIIRVFDKFKLIIRYSIEYYYPTLLFGNDFKPV